jgi:hypothetical protein
VIEYIREPIRKDTKIYNINVRVMERGMNKCMDHVQTMETTRVAARFMR